MIPNEILKIVGDEIEISMVSSFPNQRNFDYNIVRKSDGITVGYCGIILDIDPKYDFIGNIEYEIFEQYRGNNYAYKATKLLGKVALYLGINSLDISVKPGNFASVKTLQKLGARFICMKSLPKNMKLYDGKREYAVYNWKIEGEKTK